MSGFLRVPREVWDWPRREWAIAYTDLQFRASWSARDVSSKGQRVRLEPGEVLFSAREAAGWWGWTEKAVRIFAEHLEAEGLIAYPEGKEHRRLFRLKLSDFWGASRGESEGESKGARKSRGSKDLGAAGAQGGAHTGAHTGARDKEDRKKDRKEDRKEETTTVPSEPACKPAEARPSLALVRGGLPDDAEWAGDVPERLTTQQVLVAWIQVWTNAQGARPSSAVVSKQGAAAKRIAERYPGQEVAAAFIGMSQTYPFSKGASWDLFTLERRFTEAIGNAGSAPELKQAQERLDFDFYANASGF